ncbi:rhodanese-like domain-containing protein [Motiliproteus sp. SC1-56]|uniref:rhodanese-like domain-containing protein n=1 Tax=Motiliproteus sp. SC1-56 TaxID=2799565 RepID=UPI001A8E5ADE|nr:rhodanese-like domain-containing protein [Motiliproteus sp. SC1-56]
MDQLLEFASNHWYLVLALLATLAMLIFTESRKGGKSLSTHDATRLINKEDAVVLDIRQKKEFQTGHIVSAINIPYADLDKRIGELNKHKSKPVIVVCNLGQTASGAVKKLNDAQFENVQRLRGGMTEWKAQNLPVVRK